MKLVKSILLSSIFTLLSCAGRYDHKLEFNPAEPLRVAVLPFVQVDNSGKIIEESGRLLVDQVPLLSTKLPDSPPLLVQKLVEDQLSRAGIDLVSPALVVDNLLHDGFSKGLQLDTDRIWATSPQKLCEVLFCDAVLFGKVTKWERSYYALQSVATVGIETRIVSAKDQRTLFQSKAEDSTSRGLTKGPTGLSSVVLEPLKGLNSEIIVELAERTTVKLLAPLKLDSRPGYLESSAPAVYGAAISPHARELSHPAHLYVLMIGSPDNRASFSIGTALENIPMVQRDQGSYIGEYYPLPGDQFIDQPVYVDLTDKQGRTTRRRVGKLGLSLR